MKKIFAMVLGLTMILGLLSGCTEKEPFYLELTPMDADLELAPGVIIEPDEPPYNLGGWMGEDDVWWYLELPRKDTYTIRFHYSMPGEYEPNVGWLALIPEKGDQIHELPVFTATSEFGNWDYYDYVDVTLKLPKGQMALSLMPYEIAPGQDHFINLRAIEIFSGEAPEYDSQELPGGETEGPAHLDMGAEGWWVRPYGYVSEGLSLVDYFLVEDGTWTIYNEFGYPGESFSCWIEDGSLVLDMDALGSSYFGLEDGCLTNLNTGETEYIWVEDPGFQGPTTDFDDVWYRYGDLQNPSYYVLEGSHYQKIFVTGEGPSVESEGEFTYGSGMHGINELEFPDVEKITLEGDFAPDLYPCYEGNVLIENESFDYAIYIREAGCDSDFVWLWMGMEELMNSDLDGTASDGSKLSLNFEPFCFYITVFPADGEERFTLYGTWTLMESGDIVLDYSDGAQDVISVPQEESSVYLEYAGETVEMEIW